MVTVSHYTCILFSEKSVYYAYFIIGYDVQWIYDDNGQTVTMLMLTLFGRFVVVCGDGEYIVYTAMALRNKSFGQAQEFVWSHDSSQYAIREGSSTVQIFKNFKEQKSFKPDFGAEGF